MKKTISGKWRMEIDRRFELLSADAKDRSHMRHHFESILIDKIPHLLRDSYRLRYDVYCLERNFLKAHDYPDCLETDAFDPHSLHLGAMNLHDELVGTVRLVRPSSAGLPMYHACRLFPEELHRISQIENLAEISRLAISRRYHRRRGDGTFALGGAESYGAYPRKNAGRDDKRGNPPVVVSLYKSLYQASKRRGITHVLAATEKSLHRLLTEFNFPFRPIGPEVDYFGPVTPYVLDIAEFEAILIKKNPSLLDEFVNGLEMEFRPKLTQA
jgi:N-acyl amino acid synthase of PEP-CTERM/exosortase system